MKLKLFFTLCLLYPLFSASAQDYAITTKGDTIYAIIEKANENGLKLRPASGEAIKMEIQELKEFRQYDVTFLIRDVYQNSGTKRRILEFEERGAVNLLSIDGTTGIAMRNPSGYGYMAPVKTRSSFYVEKAGEVTILREVLTNGFTSNKGIEEVRKSLIAVLGDDAAMAEKIKKTVFFTRKLVKAMVREYNEKHL